MSRENRQVGGTPCEEYAEAVRRIVRAAEQGRGVRLSAHECRMMSLDMASWDCVFNDPKKSGAHD